jgi:hypothetical protein
MGLILYIVFKETLCSDVIFDGKTASFIKSGSKFPSAAAPASCCRFKSVSWQKPVLKLRKHTISPLPEFRSNNIKLLNALDKKSETENSYKIEELKLQLLDAIRNFKKMQARDGKISVDFGVSGGELNAKTRAPRNLAEGRGFYSTSEDVGLAADEVFKAIQNLESVNPTLNPTDFFGTKEGDKCPLNGPWKLLFTTAADASFSPNSTRGDAQASNIIDAVRGRITNIIEFAPTNDGKPRTVDQLKVQLKATAESSTRISFRFKYVKVRLSRLFGIFLFGKHLTLTIPVPGPFLTRILCLLRRVEAPPKAYFDVVYLDSQLRIHKTGEGNIFVQGRPDWIAQN